MQEMFGSCSRKQLNHAWQKVYTLVSQTLTGFTGTVDSDSEDPEVGKLIRIKNERNHCPKGFQPGQTQVGPYSHRR